MTTRSTIPRRVRAPRRLWLVVPAAALAASVCWAALTLTVGTSGPSRSPRRVTNTALLTTLTPAERRYVQAIARLTPAQRAAAFGTRWLDRQVSTATALRSLGPNERRYVEGIVSLAPTQLRAAFGTELR